MDLKYKKIARDKEKCKSQKYSQETLHALIDVMEQLGGRCCIDEMDGVSFEPMWNASYVTDKELSKFLEEQDYNPKYYEMK